MHTSCVALDGIALSNRYNRAVCYGRQCFKTFPAKNRTFGTVSRREYLTRNETET